MRYFIFAISVLGSMISCGRVSTTAELKHVSLDDDLVYLPDGATFTLTHTYNIKPSVTWIDIVTGKYGTSSVPGRTEFSAGKHIVLSFYPSSNDRELEAGTQFRYNRSYFGPGANCLTLKSSPNDSQSFEVSNFVITAENGTVRKAKISDFTPEFTVKLPPAKPFFEKL